MIPQHSKPPQQVPLGRGPRTITLVGDQLRAAVSRPAATITAALVIAVVCVIIFATTGRSAATEAQVIDSVNSMGTRLITVIDNTGKAGIDHSAVEKLEALEGVEWAFGMGPAETLSNPAVGVTMSVAPPMRTVIGDLPPAVVLTHGRAPASGEMILGVDAQQALGLSQASGTVAAGDVVFPVVDSFTADGELSALTGWGLLPTDDVVPLRYVYVLAEPHTDVASLARAVEAVLPAAIPGGVSIEMPAQAIQLREVLAGTLAGGSRQMMILTLLTALVLTSITMSGAVAARRRDFGRQRALGASRSAISVAVIVQSLVAGVVGVSVGLLVGLPVTFFSSGHLPSLRFVAGSVVLLLLVAVMGSLPPAVVAARRDPVRILRVP